MNKAKKLCGIMMLIFTWPLQIRPLQEQIFVLAEDTITG